MRWKNVRTIFKRELKDQLRDRRTIFMVFVFPVLLYPIMGLSLGQLATAFQAKARKVVVVGAEFLPERQEHAGEGASSETVPLLTPEGKTFDPRLFDSLTEALLLEVECVPAKPPWTDAAERRTLLREGRADARRKETEGKG